MLISNNSRFYHLCIWKILPLVFLEECKYVQEDIKTKNYIDEELKSESVIDSDSDNNIDIDIDIDIEE